MKWAPAWGYTIVEVMIVVGISALIFVASWSLFAGQGATASFSQTMVDISSAISSRIKDVTSGISSTQGYKCSLVGSPPRPVLSAGSGSGNNQDCLALGKAFEAIPGEKSLRIYSVLGTRQQYVGGTPAGLPNSLDESNTTTATANGNDLSDKFDFSGAEIVSSKVNSGSGDSDSRLVGYYLDFAAEDTNSQNGSLGSSAWAYSYLGNIQNPASVKDCIEGSCGLPNVINLWKLCFKNPDSNHFAQLDVAYSSSGPTTNLKFVNCT